MKAKEVILIGGAPMTGKTHLGKRLGKDLSLHAISTDTIRGVMRSLPFYRKRFPHVMRLPQYTADQYLTAFNPEEIVEHQIEESTETWKGVAPFIRTANKWKSFIVEGVGILPELVHKDFSGNPSIKPIFLVVGEEKIKEVVFKRGLWDKAHKYDDSLKKVEMEWTYEFNQWLAAEAREYGYPVYEIKTWDVPLSEIKKLIGH